MLENQMQMTADEQHQAETFAPLAPDQHADPLLAGHADMERLRRENALLREDIREARSAEAHVWASRVNTFEARSQMVEDRYMALVKQVADGLALQRPAPLVVFSEEAKFSPAFLQSQADEAPRLDLGA